MRESMHPDVASFVVVSSASVGNPIASKVVDAFGVALPTDQWSYDFCIG